MPIINISLSRRKGDVATLMNSVSVAAVSATGLSEDDFVVSVTDVYTNKPFTLVLVSALIKKERTAQWLQKLATAVGCTLAEYDPQADVDVFTHFQDESLGFCAIAGLKSEPTSPQTS